MAAKIAYCINPRMNSNIAGVHHSRRMIILVLSLIVAAVGNLSSTPVEGRVLLSLSSADDHSGFSQSLRRLMMNSGEEGSSAVTSAAGSGVEEGGGTKWAVLVAGSNGFGNYRHQADICHAYQILKKGGLKDENIVVMMYDDIANNPENPTKGVIINRPDGEDVYQGVPKDYTGEEVTAENLLAVILGDASGVQGGSGKVVNSSPNDHIFIYYADHGAPGVLAMPVGDTLYASDFIDTLKKKYASGTYKTMVIYIEACEAGSIFDGILPEGMNIYVTTASNPKESSYPTYCSQEQYQTCLGDLYSVSWMEDSDERMGTTETLEEQYEAVKERTKLSHVMQYGDSNMANDPTSLYMGAGGGGGGGGVTSSVEIKKASTHLVTVDQREADILYLRRKVDRAPQDSHEQVEAQKQLDEAIAQRARVDHNVAEIGERLFGAMNAEETLNKVRPVGQPLVDDWDCLKSLVAAYKTRCGSLSSYGMKYMRAFANMCNAGIQKDKMAQALSQTCS